MRKLNWIQRILVEIAGKVLRKYNAVPLKYQSRIMISGRIYIISNIQLTEDICDGSTASISAMSEHDYYLRSRIN